MSYWKSQRCISLTPNVTTLKLRQMLVKIAIPRLTKLTKNKVLICLNMLTEVPKCERI